MKTIHTIQLLLWPMLLLTACSTRDIDHTSGNMSSDARLKEIQNYYSPYLDSTFQRSLSMVNAIDTTTLSRRDRYEWLELKCNIARACDTLVTWMDDIERWVEYADHHGSDRDILAAHLHLSHAYLNHDYKWRYSKFMTIEESDSLMDLHWKELLFCVHYKEDDTLANVKGDYLCLKAEACYLLAEEFRKPRHLDYFQVAKYKQMAAKLFAIYRKHNPAWHLGRWKDWHRALLLDAAVCYRNSNEYGPAIDCIIEALALATEDGNESDLCLASAVLASIENMRSGNLVDEIITDSNQASEAKLRREFRRKTQKSTLKTINKCLADYSKDFTFPIDLLYHYKALIFFSCHDIDSAYHYSQEVYFQMNPPLRNGRVDYTARYLGTFECTCQMRTERDLIAARYCMEHGQWHEATFHYCNALNQTNQLKMRQTRNNIPLQESVARAAIRSIEERQEGERRQQKAVFIALIVALTLAALWLLTRKQRKLNRMHRDIEALNRQLNDLRAEQLKSADEEDAAHAPSATSEGNVPSPMEMVFVRKLQMKRAAFMESAQHRTVVKYALRQQSTCNPEDNAMPADVRRALMDAVLGDFSLECQQLRELYPALTAAETIYCILNLLDFGGRIGAYCMEVSHEAYRRRKSRIKAKVSPTLFECIFGASEE